MSVTAAQAQKKYDPGASDTEIRIGNIMPYSGPASSYGVIGKTEEAFFKMINAQGGINGRKVTFITYDDAYSPPKAIEQARKLVESDEVLLIFQSLGTPSNSAIMKYMNAKKVPQLFVASGGTKFGDPKNFPWTMGFQPNYQSEGRIYARYILDHFPDSKIAVFWQNDDAGKDQFKGLKDGLGDKVSMIIADKSYEVSDPASIPRSSRCTIRAPIPSSPGRPPRDRRRRSARSGTRLEAEILPGQHRNLGGLGVEARRTGIFQGHHFDGVSERPDRSDLGQRSGRAELARLHGQILSRRRQDQCQQPLRLRGGGSHGPGSQAVRRHADARQRHETGRQPEEFPSELMLPGIMVNTSADDYFPIEQMQLMKFNGAAWKLFGDVITGEVGHDATR